MIKKLWKGVKKYGYKTCMALGVIFLCVCEFVSPPSQSGKLTKLGNQAAKQYARIEEYQRQYVDSVSKLSSQLQNLGSSIGQLRETSIKLQSDNNQAGDNDTKSAEIIDQSLGIIKQLERQLSEGTQSK